MKRILVMTMAAWATDSAMPLADQVVVDRTTRDKSVNDYILLTRNEIQRAWTTPVEMTGAQAVKGRVRVNYVISRSGALRSLELVSGSGNPELDRTLVGAIRAAAPFPPFPEEIRARSLLVRAHFIVADVPSVSVKQAQAEVSREATSEDKGGSRASEDKKLIWGLPAGTAQAPDSGVEHEIPAPPPAKRYKWGL
jgi:TonB family protein